MEQSDLGIIAAIILSGLIGGERAAADEKTIKRAIDLACRLKIQLSERSVAASLGVPPAPAV